MSDPLVTYLSDHLGGAQIAVQVLKAMRDQHDDPRFQEFAGSLLPDIQADDGTLRSIAEKIGSGSSATKQVGGWLLEPQVWVTIPPLRKNANLEDAAWKPSRGGPSEAANCLL